MINLQPIITDEQGIKRFRTNEIVNFLLNTSKFNMNDLAFMPFSDEDRMQLAMLIGYSVEGFLELPYVDEEKIIDFEMVNQ